MSFTQKIRARNHRLNTGNKSFLLVNIRGAPTCFVLSYLETDILLISPHVQLLIYYI